MIMLPKNGSREICKVCYHVNPVGFYVPDEIWRSVVPEALRASVLCLACFARLADEKLIRWEQEIEFFPVSLVSHLRAVNDAAGSHAPRPPDLSYPPPPAPPAAA